MSDRAFRAGGQSSAEQAFIQCVARNGGAASLCGKELTAWNNEKTRASCGDPKKATTSTCPMPTEFLRLAKISHQLMQPIAYLTAQAYLNFWALILPVAVVLWPVVALNLVLLVMPYLVLAFVASCGDPAATLKNEAVTALNTTRMLRAFYEEHAAVRFIPFAGDFYNALGLAEVCMIPLAEGRLPSTAEMKKGEAAMKIAQRESNVALDGYQAPPLTQSQKQAARAFADKRVNGLLCGIDAAEKRKDAMAGKTTKEAPSILEMAWNTTLAAPGNAGANNSMQTAQQNLGRDLEAIIDFSNSIPESQWASYRTKPKKDALKVGAFLLKWNKEGRPVSVRQVAELWKSIGTPAGVWAPPQSFVDYAYSKHGDKFDTGASVKGGGGSGLLKAVGALGAGWLFFR